jgi:hypothetical protein
MKEKRVDILLSILSLLHLVLIGISGSFSIEFFSDQPREAVLFTTSFLTVLFVILITYLYSLAFEMIDTKNGK